MRKKVIAIIREYFVKSNYKQNVLSMLLGRILAQGLPIVLMPLFTRIYSPVEFGIFGVYMTIVSIVSMISTGRYNLAIILPRKKSKVLGLFLLSSILSIAISFIFLIFMYFNQGNIFVLLNAEELSSYVIIIFLNILFVGLYESVFYYGLRYKKYKILSKNIILQSIIITLVRLLWGYYLDTSSGLMIAYLFAYTISYVGLLLQLDLLKENLFKREESILKLMKRYNKFPKFSLLADTLSVGANLSPNLFLNKIFGSINAGFYSMADKVLGSPVWFAMSSVGDVFKQEAAEQYREKGTCYNIFIQTVKGLFIFAFLPFLFLFIFSPTIIPIVLGSDWDSVGEYIRIFSIMYFLRFVVGPVSYIVYIVDRQRLNILFQGLKFGSIVLSFTYGIYSHNLYQTLILLTILTSISYIIIFKISLTLAKNCKYSKK